MSGTLKGNMLIGQSGGPTMVVNASLVGAIEEAFRHPEMGRIFGAVNGMEGILGENLVDLTHEERGIWERIRVTPSTALGSCRLKIKEKHLQRIVDVFKAHEIRYFFYIGGNDSQHSAHQVLQLAESEGWDMRVIGIPKTIDNDLPEVDHCPGYGSAARFVVTATRCIEKDNEALHPVQFIEAMGRDTGWIAAASRGAREDPEQDAPHLIYVPERPFEEDKFVEEVKEVHARLGRVLAVVSEGLRRPDGSQVTASKRVDAFGHQQLGGMGQYLVDVIEDKMDVKARWDKLGTMQRSFAYCMSETDLGESYEVGRLAVWHASQGVTGKMVTLLREPGEEYVCTFGLTDLENVAEQTRYLDDKYVCQDRADIDESFLDYVEPLALGRRLTLGPEFVSFPRLKRYPVERKLPAYEP